MSSGHCSVPSNCRAVQVELPPDISSKTDRLDGLFTIRKPEQIRQDAASKLRSIQVSDHFKAILGCLLGEDWTTPQVDRDTHHPRRPYARSLRGRVFVQSVPTSKQTDRLYLLSCTLRPKNEAIKEIQNLNQA